MIFFQTERWDDSIAVWKDYLNLETRKDNIVMAKFLIANAYETVEKLKEYGFEYSFTVESGTNRIFDPYRIQRIDTNHI